MAETKVTTVVGIKHNSEEFALIEWLKIETSRSRSGTYKFAAAKLAKELGYQPLKRKGGHPRKSSR